MKIRLLTGRVGTGFTQQPGEIIEVPPQEAQRMIEAWQAVVVADEKNKFAGRPAVQSRG